MKRWIGILMFCLPVAACDEANGPAAGQAAKLSPAWEQSGFKNPESVVYEPNEGVLFVSNVDGTPMDKDGQGFVSRVSLDGEILDEKWVDGLDAPKGLAVSGGKLYVADIDALVEVDLADRTLTRYPAEGAKFFNDVAADDAGRIYVADTFTNAIWRLEDGDFSAWVMDPALAAPNGLLVEGDVLIVAPFGETDPGTGSRTPEHLRTVDLDDLTIASLGDGTPVGNLDGLEPDGQGNYYVSDWVSGGLWHVTPSGAATKLLPLASGSADFTIVPGAQLLVIPMMNDGKLLAYRME